MTARRPCPPAPGPLEDYAARFDDLKQTARMAWSIDRRAVLLLVCCQLAIEVRAGLQLASTRGKLRYVVKQTFALLHQFTRLAVR